MNSRFLQLLLVSAACGWLGTTMATGQKPVAAAKATGEQPLDGADERNATIPSLAEVKAAGARTSRLRKHQPHIVGNATPQPRLAEFHQEIEPILQISCVDCHGPDTQAGEFRVDTLDPDVLHGRDVDWWLEVFDVLSNGEMPPEDEGQLTDADRSKVVEWLSAEIQVASAVRRSKQGHSAFRRMTRYETNYTLQDLLGLPYDFTQDLPPETASQDGFQNSSEVLQMSATQFAYYRDLSREALEKATVRGQRPELLYWGISMEAAAAQMQGKYDAEVEKLRERFNNKPESLKQELEKHAAQFSTNPKSAYYKNLSTGTAFKASWNYRGAKYAWKPAKTRPAVPAVSDHVVIIPPHQKLVVELGNAVPDAGILRIRIRASRTSLEENITPSLRLEFGFQASNNSSASASISDHDVGILASPDNPEFYQWDIPLSEITLRNPMRRTEKMGDTPNPSEYLKLHNSAISRGDIQIDYMEIIAPVYEDWPPASHKRIFIDSPNQADETEYARDVLTNFMPRVWRCHVADSAIDQKMALFAKIRPTCDDFQQAMIEVLAAALSSPKFLYLVQAEIPNPADEINAETRLDQFELATRLSMFLWCSAPDDELLGLAAKGMLSESDVLVSQTKRLLADARCERFCRHFVRQWLGMQLLDFLDVDEHAYPQFDPFLREAMQEEPIAFFREVLQENRSVMDFLHAEYTMVNERLAKHYGLPDVYGNHFRMVTLGPEDKRGGLLPQAGLLAMNSDGKDSHPLKRGIWLLERLLNDPPPPPPPAVPEIDLADPRIAKMTLKERIEDHRNDPACISCHAKIDPWGIAFENYDAVGSWRTRIRDTPVDASSLLFNNQELDGMEGLKRFLLSNRQDQFARAMVHKLTTYALGRPLTFDDRSEIDRMAAELRKQDDGLATLIMLIVTSELFQSK